MELTGIQSLYAAIPEREILVHAIPCVPEMVERKEARSHALHVGRGWNQANTDWETTVRRRGVLGEGSVVFGTLVAGRNERWTSTPPEPLSSPVACSSHGTHGRTLSTHPSFADVHHVKFLLRVKRRVTSLYGSGRERVSNRPTRGLRRLRSRDSGVGMRMTKKLRETRWLTPRAVLTI